MKATRHNGRAGKHGTYNPKHNDRRFDLENSEHIDAKRAQKNIYWDCYRGYTSAQDRGCGEQPDTSFEDIERAYYQERYGAFVEAQNERNAQTRHTERNGTIDSLLQSNKTCPEETIFQIGTIEGSVSPETLLGIVEDFKQEFDRRFGERVHILDWALHLDEGTPHIHERHVFDCENRHGEICPQQEKALEALDISLPDESRPKGRNNNRKQTFDAICRALLFDIARRHGVHLDEEPTYGGRKYLEKQDYILFAQEKRMQEMAAKIDDAQALIDEVSGIAYDKAVEVVTDAVRAETQKADLAVIEAYQGWVTAPERKTPQDMKDFVGKCLDVVQNKLRSAAQKVFETVMSTLMKPDVRREHTEAIGEKAKPSILQMLRKKRESDTGRQTARKQDMEI